MAGEPAKSDDTPPAATVADILARRVGDPNPGLWFEGREWTWGEITDAAAVRAAYLDTHLDGNRPRHVGVLLDNSPEYLFLLAGAAISGAVLVGLNPTRRGEELARDLRHTDCRLVITDAGHADLLADLDLGAATDRVVLVDTDAYRDAIAAAATASAGAARPVPAPDDLLLLIFTSGSSGAPKAVRVTQGRAARAAQTKLRFGPGESLYCAMPLFHGNALMSTVFPAAAGGARIVLTRRFSASAVLPDVREHGCVFFSTIGRALSYILATPPSDHDRDHQLKIVLGPESSTADVRAFQQRFGVMVVSGYGSSENAIVMVPAPGLPKHALGEPLPGLDVAIIDPESGEESPRAEFDDHGRLLNAATAVGEIVGRTALRNFEGYYNNPEANAERSRNGWYWSGDLGYRDADGVFFFAGRTADWIRVDGENFAAAPIERILERFPDVGAVAVFGVPDERTVDDQVMAALEYDASAFDPTAFDAFLAEQRDMGTKWAPRYVRVVDALPVGATNKLDKKPLRSARWMGPDPVYWRPDRKGPLVRMHAADIDALHEAFAEHGRAAVIGG